MLYREIENRYWSAGERKKEKKKQVRFQISPVRCSDIDRRSSLPAVTLPTVLWSDVKHN